jgi:hypothetical protein
MGRKLGRKDAHDPSAFMAKNNWKGALQPAIVSQIRNTHCAVLIPRGLLHCACIHRCDRCLARRGVRKTSNARRKRGPSSWLEAEEADRALSTCHFRTSTSREYVQLSYTHRIIVSRRRTGYTGDRDLARVLRLLQADHDLPRHNERSRLHLHVRCASLRSGLLHGDNSRSPKGNS